MQKGKNVRNPAQEQKAGSHGVVQQQRNYNYYIVINGYKHFYSSPHQLIQAALAGVV